MEVCFCKQEVFTVSELFLQTLLFLSLSPVCSEHDDKKLQPLKREANMEIKMFAVRKSWMGAVQTHPDLLASGVRKQ